MRAGYTLVELVIVVIVISLLTALGIPSLRGVLDRIAVERAASRTAAFYSGARLAAVLQGRRVRIEFHADSLVAVYEAEQDSTFSREVGPAIANVRFVVSRATVRIRPNGIGLGAANTKLVFMRGAAAESLTVSRLGRIRRFGGAP